MAIWMREDEAIRDDVIAELESDPEITDAARIGVSVHNGVVTLTGSVSSYPQRLAAEKAARRVDGVKAVANDIEVKLPTAGVRSDTDIAEAAVNALRWDIQVPDERIQVTVHEGWVTLEGDVDYWYQKQAAERDVRSLQGVKGVINNIRVMAPASHPPRSSPRSSRPLSAAPSSTPGASTSRPTTASSSSPARCAPSPRRRRRKPSPGPRGACLRSRTGLWCRRSGAWPGPPAGGPGQAEGRSPAPKALISYGPARHARLTPRLPATNPFSPHPRGLVCPGPTGTVTGTGKTRCFTAGASFSGR